MVFGLNFTLLFKIEILLAHSHIVIIFSNPDSTYNLARLELNNCSFINAVLIFVLNIFSNSFLPISKLIWLTSFGTNGNTTCSLLEQIISNLFFLINFFNSSKNNGSIFLICKIVFNGNSIPDLNLYSFTKSSTGQ